MTGDRVVDPATTLAAHQRVHQGSEFVVRCTCGWTCDRRGTGKDMVTLHAAHLLAVLADAGYAVVKLPKVIDVHRAMVFVRDGKVVDSTAGVTLSPRDTREFAAALLAAAAAAEGEVS